MYVHYLLTLSSQPAALELTPEGSWCHHMHVLHEAHHSLLCLGTPSSTAPPHVGPPTESSVLGESWHCTQRPLLTFREPKQEGAALPPAGSAGNGHFGHLKCFATSVDFEVTRTVSE